MTALPGNRFKAVAFDLDGTLADTAGLSTSRRAPAMVLELCRAHQRPTNLEFSRKVSRLPSRVMQRGAIVAVVTRSPFAYATTLCYLLGLDYNVLFTSRDGSSVESRLRKIITGAKIQPGELLYVGDRDADRAAAEAVGASFVLPPWLSGDTDDTGVIQGATTHTSLLDDMDHPPYHEGSLLIALRQAAVTGGRISAPAFDAFVSADLDEELRSALAWMLLRSAPAQSRRDELQRIAFAAVPATGYDCVIPRRSDYGMTCVSRAVMRRSEYERVTVKRESFFELLRDLHPPWRIKTSRMTSDHPNVPVLSFRRFHDQRGGELLRTAKNWGGPGKGQAGPEVVLSLIELPTLVIASHLAASIDTVPVVPVPASPFMTQKPGQVSQRIAIDAAVLSGREYLDVLTKSDAGVVCRVQGQGREVTVVDDQLTYGGSVSDAVSALIGAGFKVRDVTTWSASQRHWTGAPYIVSKCWLSDAQWLIGRGGACEPHHRGTPSPDAREVAKYLNSVEL